MAGGEQTENGDVRAGVEVVELLLEAADGGRFVSLDEYRASTVLALLQDAVFRDTVLAAASGVASE